MDAATYLDIVTKVDQFYKSSWDHLVIIGTLIFIVLGIVFPVLVQMIFRIKQQKRELKIKNELIDDLNKFKTDITKSIEDRFIKEVEVINNQMGTIKAKSLASSYHLQGMFKIDKGDYKAALGSLIYSSNLYLDCEDHYGLNIVLYGIYDTCLPNVSYDDLANLKIFDNRSISKLLDRIDAEDTKGAFAPIVKNIKIKLNEIKVRKESKP